jgi:hypothetical protein
MAMDGVRTAGRVIHCEDSAQSEAQLNYKLSVVAGIVDII